MLEAWFAIYGSELPASTVSTVFDRWLARRKNEVDPHSHVRYAGLVRGFLAFLGDREDDDLSSLSSSDILRFRDYQADRMSATSANVSVKVVRSAFKCAILERLLTENPAAKEFIDKIKRKNGNKRRRAFQIPELQKLLAIAEGTEWKGLILAGLYLGQRLGDTARLSWANVELAHSEISIVTEKTERVQIIPIAPPLLRYLAEELPTPEDPTAPLFPRAYDNASAWGASDL
jgi:integrase